MVCYARFMMIWLQDVFGLLTLMGLGAVAWHLLGRAAQRAGTSRLAVIGALFLMGNLLG
jgi:hypothetical protein